MQSLRERLLLGIGMRDRRTRDAPGVDDVDDAPVREVRDGNSRGGDGITPQDLLSNPYPNGLNKAAGSSLGLLTQTGSATIAFAIDIRST